VLSTASVDDVVLHLCNLEAPLFGVYIGMPELLLVFLFTIVCFPELVKMLTDRNHHKIECVLNHWATGLHHASLHGISLHAHLRERSGLNVSAGGQCAGSTEQHL